LGPKIVYHDGAIQPSCRRFMTFSDLIIKRTVLKHFSPLQERLRQYIMQDFHHNAVSDVDLLVGACFLMRKEVFERVGGFDKRYFLFMEDFDLCQKIHLENLRVVYFPKTTVTHYHKRLSDGNMVKLLFQKPFWHHLISSAKYFWRWR
ncbi:glycosyltransferase family 2 protein, partial [Candidatus Peregrinibacteria bacterium]|nr:glycosyltransferase family 2 protein [Candidatus Peregrinibacteria bacterium]